MSAARIHEEILCDYIKNYFENFLVFIDRYGNIIVMPRKVITTICMIYFQIYTERNFKTIKCN